MQTKKINFQLFAENSKMKQQSRDIFLFFEENEDENATNCKMVRLYMNRFIIDEEQRLEIFNVSELTKVPMLESYTKKSVAAELELSQFIKKSMEKWSKDKQIILSALRKSLLFGRVNTETHIIMGSLSYACIDDYRVIITPLIIMNSQKSFKD